MSQDLSEAKITVTAVPDRPGQAALIFETLADLGVNLDMIVQNVSEEGHTDITITLPTSDLACQPPCWHSAISWLSAI